MIRSLTLWNTLKSLKGNQKACVVTEPLWAIPNQLILPFASLYMLSIGLKDAEIGQIAGIGFIMQCIWAVLSGALVDKYGRRRMMLVFGLMSWTLPCLLWAVAQSYWYFLAAVILNSAWRVTGNSFSCMIVEDGDRDQLINIYTILNGIGLIAGFITPILGVFIDRFSLSPTIRGVYLVAMVLMTLKFLWQYYLAHESSIGLQQREKSKGSSILRLTFTHQDVFQSIFKNRPLKLFIILMSLVTCYNIVQATFWPIFITSELRVSDATISIFPTVRTVTTLFVFLLVNSRMRIQSVMHPFLIGFGAHLLGLLLLIVAIPYNYMAIEAAFVSAICDAIGLAILGPLIESKLSVLIPNSNRAKINSYITALILLLSAPMVWMAGQISQVNRMYPFLLNISLLLIEMLLVLYMEKRGRKRVEHENN